MVETLSHSIASCNIDGDRHLTSVRDFLRLHSPDIVCFQEASEIDTQNIAHDCDYELAFRANAIVKKDFVQGISEDKIFGLAILSRIEIISQRQYTYAGNPNVIPTYVHRKPNSRRREIFSVDLLNNFRIATTHFTWAPEGTINDEQRSDLPILIEKARLLGECIFAGDFNFLRPTELYQKILEVYKDNIPPDVSSSIDPHIHPRGKSLKLLIDYLFTTPAYQISSVELIEGVSDHKAVLARVKKL